MVKLVLKLKDIVRTPLGVTGTVIGVKMELTEEAAQKAAEAAEPDKKGKDKKKK
ncbi:hypothetical protein ABBQ32_010540 [Trebouxia sp. C0010 RCD-2024]